MHANGMRPSGVYSVEGNLTNEQHDRLTAVLRRRNAVGADVTDATSAADDGTAEEPGEAEPVALAGKPAPGAKPIRPTATRAGRPSGKRRR